MPSDPTGELRELASQLSKESARLVGTLHPVTRGQVAALVRNMNSYYSNLIEGHYTHPADIEKALKNDYSAEPEKRALQIESAAHVNVEALMRDRLERADEDVCTDTFVRWLHQEFFERLPPELRVVHGVAVEPGAYRKREVRVGAHLAPAFVSLPRFMARFGRYEPRHHDPLDRIIAAGAAHHRFAWMHPFQDGNGRVGRLLTQAYFTRAGLETGGLWTISRGFARHREKYRDTLSAADAQRRNDLDGRGNLSNEALVAFCRFFLGIARDQVRFMAEMLDLDRMQDRIRRFAERQVTIEDAPPGLGSLMREAFLRGSVPRGEAARALGMHERTARRHVAKLLESGLFTSESPGAPLTLAFSAATVGYLFPRLFPEGVELSNEPTPSDIERAKERLNANLGPAQSQPKPTDKDIPPLH